MPKKTSQYKKRAALIFSIFIAGLCSIIYELLIATTASYFEGDSVKQFSTTIGFYMAFMGVGSFASRFIQKRLLVKFLSVELLLSLLGGISIPILYLVFAHTEAFPYYKAVFISVIAVLIGLEIPLLLRLMKKYYPLKTNISNILSLDYLGALAATLLFPFVLFPFLGTFKTSLIFGLVNIGLVFMNLFVFHEEVVRLKNKTFQKFLALSIGVSIILTLSIFSASFLIRFWNNNIYTDRVIYLKRSPYQNIVLTRYKSDVRMYLNGSLQFSSIDEYRYHESLVHIPMELLEQKTNVLILGGGDGLALRELLKYPEVENIHLVDLDAEVVKIAKTNEYLTALNQKSLFSDKVSIYHEDAFTFLKKRMQSSPKRGKKFDLIIADLPDPNHISLAKLYSLEFYKLIQRNLRPDGLFVTQATSPFHAKRAFWCIQTTIKEAGFHTYPYHLNVPSFAEWGFILASFNPLDIGSLKITKETRFLDDRVSQSLFVFSRDIQSSCETFSSLERPVVLNHYLQEWWYD